MPFTVSHIVAVLPLASGRPGRWLVPSALAIGSMVPDLPYFVPPHVGAEWSHSAAGPVTVDLLFGLVLFALWRLVLAEPLADLAPHWLRARLPPPVRLRGRAWPFAALSVVLGATTHVAWDTFSHPDRWGTRHIAALTTVYAGLPGFKWVQYGSGVLGLLVLLLWFAAWTRRTEPDRSPGWTPAPLRLAAWCGVAAVFVATVALTWAAGIRQTGSWVEEVVAVRIATRSIALTTGAAVALCLAWQAARRVDPRGSSTRPLSPPD